ncbi:Response regulator of zinc sigma-54-dependent two-component system [Labilithrix luteola]|uniref:Response regulator of zinc sigma-54-dependent two-component system n=2 Tax=Labilithrix luteola TaxID=1391654 RepID=A0A0K1PJC1_9BACT|nr:Response regulator of zinc sigma-54-dependent two-component system [Labilithrix luteola]
MELESEIESLRDSECNVLILGETGTGKSVLGRRIHALSARARGPFVDVNCAGLAIDFVESELFGHERGSFTGAYAAKSGLLEASHGGTLFLDEIGDMDIRVQSKVLKVLEEKRFRRMGDLRERQVDIRLVAATNADMLEAIERKTFRQDLYYRISTVTLTVPPLRERREDILPIATDMLVRLTGGDGVEISPSALAKLENHGWPGNLRELGNVLERALLRRRGHTLRPEELHFDPVRGAGRPAHVAAFPSEPPSGVRTPPTKLLAGEAGAASRDEIEREHILLALDATRGRVQDAARRLGISRSTLYAKLKLYDIANVRRPTTA